MFQVPTGRPRVAEPLEVALVLSNLHMPVRSETARVDLSSLCHGVAVTQMGMHTGVRAPHNETAAELIG